jgi:hypothetical protein
MYQKPSSISSQEIKVTLNSVDVSHVVRKHIDHDNETDSESEAVLEGIGFLKGFIESIYTNI